MSVFKRFFKYLRDLIRGTAHLESKSDTACVCVGMERASKWGECPGAGIDAQRMSNLLAKYGSTVLLQDAQATASAVASALQDALKKDLCIFFYSGHGGRVRNPKAEDGSGYSEHLCVNNGALYDYTLWQLLQGAKGRVVMIFDCCHSATMYRTAQQGDVWNMNQGFRFSFLDGMASAQKRNDILVWSGCPSTSYSYGDANGGVLTNGILHAYRESRTYDDVWRIASKQASAQHPVRTKLGEGFDGKVFR